MRKYDPDSLTGYAILHRFEGPENEYKVLVYNVYTSNSMFVSDREFVYTRDFKWVELKDGRKAALVFGGNLDDCKRFLEPQNGLVRGILHCYGWLYVPDEEKNSLEVHYLFHTNPAGYVPATLVNAMSSRQANCVKVFRDDLKKGLL